MSCKCSQFDDIELYRDEVTKRIKKTKSLKRLLETIAEIDGANKLLKCPECQQHWQSACAWNWGGKEYLFKVPTIPVDEWTAKPYVRPDEMLLYSALMHDYMEKNNFVEKETACKAEGCANNAVQYSVFCLKDHIASLQEVGALPRYPQGRWFPPYAKT